MRCRFKTNIDCMKRFMGNISGLPIDPQVGDLVRVYHDSQFEVDLKVVERSWTFTNGSDPQLTCELHLPPYWESVDQFTKIMREHGIR